MPAARRDAQAQALRLRRYWMALAASTTLPLAVLTLFLVNSAGSRPPAVMVVALLLYWTAVAVIFYAAFRFGLNLRFADPSLTAPMMLSAIVAVSGVIYFAGPYGGLFALFYLLVLQFAQFRLRRAAFLRMAVVCILACTAANAAWWWMHGTGLAALLSRIVVIVLVFFCFALIGSYLSELRQRLHDTLKALTAAYEKNDHLATIDHLTQALNRRAVMRKLAREKRIAESAGGTFSIGLADLDGLRCINEDHGHVAGDKALSHLVRCLRPQLRESDLIGRYGDEEFLIILPNVGLDAAERIAERLRRAVADSPLDVGDRERLWLTISVGVVEYRAGETIDDLIERTERALHGAKAAGRNRVCSGASLSPGRAGG